MTVVTNELIDALRRAVGTGNVVTDPAALRTYASDGLLQYRRTPGVAVLPGAAAEVQAVVRACHAAGAPWTARGTGTGLSGGAVAQEGGVLIVLTRMYRVLEVDLAGQRVVVEPGVTNTAVSAAVGPGYYYPPDPSSQVVCSIGGNVAENSGGAHCFKYGFTTNYVLGLDVVLPDGELVELGGPALDPPGYDLVGAFVGSEGTLGIATAITLRIAPMPEHTRTLVAFYDSIDLAGDVVSRIVAAGIVPAAIEIMDSLSIEATEHATGAGYRLDAGAALIVELDGQRAACEAGFARVRELVDQSPAIEVRIPDDAGERALIWKARKAAFGAMGHVAPAYHVQDGVVPRTRLPDVLRRIQALATEADLRVANVFHAGDGNLHPLICYDRHRPGEAERAEALASRILAACVDAGGSITGEHGIGLDKRAYISRMYGPEDVAAFERLRRAFDPDGRANPGKVMPPDEAEAARGAAHGAEIAVGADMASRARAATPARAHAAVERGHG